MGDKKVGKIKDDLPGVGGVGTPHAEKVKEKISYRFRNKFSSGYGRNLCDDLGPGQWMWVTYYSIGADSKAREMGRECSELEKEVKEALLEMDSLREEYQQEHHILANLHFITSTGAVGKYQRKRRHVRELEKRVSNLGLYIQQVKKDSYWEEETRKGTYMVYPYRLKTTLTSDFSHENTEEWHLTLTVYEQGDKKDTKNLVGLARTFAKEMQEAYDWLDIRLTFEEEITLYRKLKE